jgi:hypothetical protein
MTARKPPPPPPSHIATVWAATYAAEYSRLRAMRIMPGAAAEEASDAAARAVAKYETEMGL